MTEEKALADGEGAQPNLAAVTHKTPKEIVAYASDAAQALIEVIKAKPKSKGLVKQDGSRYTEYDEYQLIAKFMGEGFTTQTIRTERVELPDGNLGWKCYAEGTDEAGVVRASADAVCCTDEPTWANKPDFQRLSMAQTRAHAKCHRQKYSYVAILAGFSATPREEMDGVVSQAETRPAPAASPQSVSGPAFKFGKGVIGKLLSDPKITLSQLENYGSYLKEHLNDPGKEEWRTRNEAHIQEVRDEYERRMQDQDTAEESVMAFEEDQT